MLGGGGRRCGASLTDDNAAYGDLDKQNVQIISEQCPRLKTACAENVLAQAFIILFLHPANPVDLLQFFLGEAAILYRLHVVQNLFGS